MVTYDEGRTNAACCGRPAGGGHVMTVVASPLGSRGFTSTVPHDHYSLLRTIEDAWELGHLGHADDPSTESLAEFFAPAATPSPDYSPAPGWGAGRAGEQEPEGLAGMVRAEV